jgi:vitamin K-dependent gamma-carboxylase
MVTELLFKRVDARSLYAFRILFGGMMFAAVVRFWAKGWIEELYLRPSFHFKYWGFSWIEHLPAPWIHVHFALLAICAALVAAGVFYRPAIVLFFLLFTHLELSDVTYYLNHYYLISVLSFLMIFLPLAKNGEPLAPAWCSLLLRAQVGMVYFFAGVAKLKSDWLFRAEPLRTWLRAHQDFPLVGRWFDEPVVAYLASWSGALFDLSIVPLLLHRRTRRIAYAVLILFHVVTAALFQLGMFPWIMIVAALVFFPPGWPSRSPLPPVRDQRGWSRARQVGAALAVLHLGVQVVLPLRHHLYPGEVGWHEQGFRYAWHVMLVEKAGYVVFDVRDRRSGREWTVYPSEYLTPQQQKMMATQPDLILQLAHHIADDFRARGLATDPAVHADAWVSFNGRPSRRLIDPDVDLAKQEDGLSSKAWISSRI